MLFHKSKDWKTDKAIMSALSKEEIDLFMALLKKSSRKPKNTNKPPLSDRAEPWIIRLIPE